MMDNETNEDQEWLLQKSIVVEQPFSSSVPFLGPLITWFREKWLNMAARWYVRPMVDQQNKYNRLIIERIHDFETYVFEVSAEHDREISRLRHDVAAVRHQLTMLNRRLEQLDEDLQQDMVIESEDE